MSRSDYDTYALLMNFMTTRDVLHKYINASDEDLERLLKEDFGEEASPHFIDVGRDVLEDLREENRFDPFYFF